jgi:hypothetical protein
MSSALGGCIRFTPGDPQRSLRQCLREAGDWAKEKLVGFNVVKMSEI